MKFIVFGLAAATFIGVILYIISWGTNVLNLNQQHIILFCLATALTLSLSILSNFITDYFSQRDIQKKQLEAFASIEKIERHLDKTAIVLKFRDRHELPFAGPAGFYNNIYNKASDIRISGLKITKLIDNIVKIPKESFNWVEKLKMRQNVVVKILVVSPDSPQINDWEQREGLAVDSVKNDIIANFQKLQNFAFQNASSKLADGTSIVIRAINEIQYFEITYAGASSNQQTDNLFLSISFSHNSSPMYEITNTHESTTHRNCLAYFDKVFADGRDIFSWNSQGPKYH